MIGASLRSNLAPAELLKAALAAGEGQLAANGALSVDTGARTGRSPKDRFIVQDDVTRERMDWGLINQPFEPSAFATLWQRALDAVSTRPVYHSRLAVGADPHYALHLDVYTETAWHQLFARHVFIDNVTPTSDAPTWTILSVPSFKTDPVRDNCRSDATVLLNFSEHKVLICGTHYAGEMKKALFTVMNDRLPDFGALPMHCAANIGSDDDVCLFFGLSGTGKTTLSTDPERQLVGDDEHGWSEQGVFNFEGGCYAKCIHLNPDHEPLIWNAIRDGAIVENVPLQNDGSFDFASEAKTQNTRAAYPRSALTQCVPANRGPLPRHVIFLTCDLFGVLPPVAQLNSEQAAYYFLSGYTALIGSTEMGHNAAIQTTFSPCFGAPFFPRPTTVYAKLLMQHLSKTGAQVYLVNTGWQGGPYGRGGERFAIPVTRNIIRAIQNDEVQAAPKTILPGFGLQIPLNLPAFDTHALDPRIDWHGEDNYATTANQLIEKFQQHFARIPVDEAIQQAGPVMLTAAEGHAD